MHCERVLVNHLKKKWLDTVLRNDWFVSDEMSRDTETQKSRGCDHVTYNNVACFFRSS